MACGTTGGRGMRYCCPSSSTACSTSTSMTARASRRSCCAPKPTGMTCSARTWDRASTCCRPAPNTGSDSLPAPCAYCLWSAQDLGHEVRADWVSEQQGIVLRRDGFTCAGEQVCLLSRSIYQAADPEEAL